MLGSRKHIQRKDFFVINSIHLPETFTASSHLKIDVKGKQSGFLLGASLGPFSGASLPVKLVLGSVKWFACMDFEGFLTLGCA